MRQEESSEFVQVVKTRALLQKFRESSKRFLKRDFV